MGSKKKSAEHYSDSSKVKAEVGEALKLRRQHLGLSRADVASELETTETSLYRWETGRSPLDLDTLSGLASVYNTDVPSLFTVDEQQFSAARDLLNEKGETHE